MSDTVIVALISLVGTIITVCVNGASQRRKTKEDIREQFKELEKKLDSHIKSDEETEQKARRTRLLRFSDELRNGTEWSKEYFDDVLEDIDDYEKYCDRHPAYHNGKGKLAMQHIHAEYNKRFLHI